MPHAILATSKFYRITLPFSIIMAISRGYYAFIKNPRINSKGFNTSAIMGFLNSIFDILNREKPKYFSDKQKFIENNKGLNILILIFGVVLSPLPNIPA